MSSTISPDGQYYWDGTRWVPNVSRWQSPTPPPRQPTKWTRPLQVATVLVFGLQGLWNAGLPFWYIGVMTQYANAMNQQFGSGPPPPDMAASLNAMNAAMTVEFYVQAAVVVALCTAVIVAAIKRWTWAHYAIFGLLALEVLWLGFGSLSDLMSSFVMSRLGPGGPGVALPWPVVVPQVVSLILSAALLLAFTLAWIRLGPWGMRVATASETGAS